MATGVSGNSYQSSGWVRTVRGRATLRQVSWGRNAIGGVAAVTKITLRGMFRRVSRIDRALAPSLFAGLALGCATTKEPSPLSAVPPAPPAASATASAAPSATLRQYGPTWGDSSGKSGRGGTKLTVVEGNKLPLAPAGFDKSKRGDATTASRPDWLLFHGPDSDSLMFEWTWVTRDSDKFFGQTWGGGGFAFNGSWVSVDATDAKYLVLWVKASQAGVNLEARLHSALKTKGQEDTGAVSLARFVPGGRLDETWKRAVIPLSAFPELDRVELKGLQQLMFTVKAEAENRAVSVFVDNAYLSNAEMVTPVSNLGYLVTTEGLELAWDKAEKEKIDHFAIALKGREVGRAPATARAFVVPKKELGSAPVTVSVVSVGRAERSEAVAVEVNPVLAQGAAATVTLGKPAHAISPHVLGVNWAPPETLRDIGAGGNRWGGNRTTKYNWKDDIDSAGQDWFFLNGYGVEPGTPETEKSYYRFVKDTLGAKVPVNFTIPITPFVAKKHPTKGQRYCSYPTSLYPNQPETDGQGCGNGRGPDKKPIWGNDPNLGMTKNSPELQKQFVETLVKLFGPAAKGGVEFYTLDNEPGLWMHTHRDTMAKGVSAEELVRWNLEYAAAVKSADPTAKVIGFAAWGVKELAGSNVDYFKEGAADAYKLPEEGSFQEVKKHGGDTQLVYFLKEAKKAEAKAGKRLIDVIDVHWYHELWAKNSLGRSERTLSDVPYDPVFTPVQFESLREWWDPTFVPVKPIESWTFDPDPQKDRLWRPYHPIVSALKKLIDTHYPGTRLAINEYDNGSPEQYHGALLRAAALGFFGREDLYMAQNWHQTGRDKFTYFAQKLYGNYDGQGGKVGGKYVPATSSSADLYAFGAARGTTTTVVFVNRNRSTPVDATLALATAAKRVRTFTLAESAGLRLVERVAKPEAGGKTLKVNVPAFAAMLVEISG